MIKIPACFRCKHFLKNMKVEEKMDEYGQPMVKQICEAHPEGIPNIKVDADDEECANGICYEEKVKN